MPVYIQAGWKGAVQKKEDKMFLLHQASRLRDRWEHQEFKTLGNEAQKLEAKSPYITPSYQIAMSYDFLYTR